MAKKLFVGNMSWNTRNDGLRAAFEQFGEVIDAVVIMERDNPNRSRGFGFVEFANDEDAEQAIAEMNETELDGRRIMVNEAKPRED